MMASQGWKPSRAIAKEVEHRAARVRYPGEWLGFFEWIARGVLRQVRVHMMFGEHIVDMMQTFAPDLYTYPPKSTHRAIAVRIHEGSLLTSASLDSPHPCVNLYVAGRPTAGAPSPEAASTMGPVHGNCEDAALAASRQGWFFRGDRLQGRLRGRRNGVQRAWDCSRRKSLENDSDGII